MLKHLMLAVLLVGGTPHIHDALKQSASPVLTDRNGVKDGMATRFSVTNNQTTSCDKDRGNPESAHWYMSPEWWLCILGVPTLMFVAVQSWLMKRHAEHFGKLAASAETNAKATAEAAESALRQIEHIETTERAWLILNFVSMKDKQLKDDEVADCRWSIKNVGATPAILLETQTRFQIVRIYDNMPDDPAKVLPVEPDYGQPIIINERLLAPQDSIGYFRKWERFTDGQFAEFAFPANAKEVWMVIAYGYVKYRDTFGKERESRSCDFTLVGRGDQIVADFRPHPKAPAAYNRCT